MAEIIIVHDHLIMVVMTMSNMKNSVARNALMYSEMKDKAANTSFFLFLLQGAKSVCLSGSYNLIIVGRNSCRNS